MRGRKFTQQGKEKAIRRSIRALRQEVAGLELLWARYDEWITAHWLEDDRKHEVADCERALERIEDSIDELMETIDFLEDALVLVQEGGDF